MTRYPPHLNLFGPIHIHRAAADQDQIPHNSCWLIFSKKNPFTAAAFLAAGCWWCWCSDKGPTHLSMVHDESTLDTVLKEIRTPRGFLLLNVFCPIPSHNLSQSSPSSPQSSQVQWQGNLGPGCGHTVVSLKFYIQIFGGDNYCKFWWWSHSSSSSPRPPMTGEFRGKLWAHRARDWAINSPECGALIMVSVIVLEIFVQILFNFLFHLFKLFSIF